MSPQAVQIRMCFAVSVLSCKLPHLREVSLAANRELHPCELQRSPSMVLTQGLLVGTHKVLAEAVSIILLGSTFLQDPRVTENIAMCLLRVQPAFKVLSVFL